MRRILIAAATMLAAVLLASGCNASVSVGKKTVSKDQVAQQISDQLTKQIGQTPDDVTCPDDLEAKVGATLTCVLTDGSDQYDVAVKVTSVKDGKADFSIQVADQPN